jgi:hypothetical protein
LGLAGSALAQPLSHVALFARPLAGPEPTANPDSQTLRLRPGH